MFRQTVIVQLEGSCWHSWSCFNYIGYSFLICMWVSAVQNCQLRNSSLCSGEQPQDLERDFVAYIVASLPDAVSGFGLCGAGSSFLAGVEAKNDYVGGNLPKRTVGRVLSECMECVRLFWGEETS